MLAIDPLQAKAIVATLHRLELQAVTLEDINQAIDGVVLWQVSFWDALILTVAGRANCSVVYSERSERRTALRRRGGARTRSSRLRSERAVGERPTWA